MAMGHERADDIEDDAASQLRRIVVDVVGRRDLDGLHAAQSLSGNGVNHLQRFSWQEAARLGRAGPRREARIDRVDIERQIDGLATLPGHFESDLGGLFGSVSVDIMHGQHAGAAPLRHRGSRSVAVPAADADLHEVLWVTVREPDVVHMTVITMGGDGSLVRSPEPGCGMHAFIHILFLDVDVAIDMDDADIAVDMRRDPTDIWKAETVVAAANDGKHARGVDVRDCFGNLVEGLLDITRDDKDVTGVAEIELLVNIDPAVEPIAVVEG